MIPSRRSTRAVDDPATRSILREVMRLAQPEVIVTLGRHAERVASAEAPTGDAGRAPRAVRQDGSGGPRGSRDWRRWPRSPFARDVAKGPYLGGREPIPRGDLPFGTLRWQATTGDRAQRGRIGGTSTPNYYKLRMPTWAANSSPTALTAAEAAAVAALKAHP